MRGRKFYRLKDIAAKVSVPEVRLQQDVRDACKTAKLRVRRDKFGDMLVPIELSYYLLYRHKVVTAVQCFRELARNEFLPLFAAVDRYKRTGALTDRAVREIKLPVSNFVFDYFRTFGSEGEQNAAAIRFVKGLRSKFVGRA